MKTMFVGSAVAALAFGSLPAADGFGAGPALPGATVLSATDPGDDLFDRRGRGRGGDRRGSGHGDPPRVPGGSGCDDPRDLVEHPECRI